MVRCEQCNEEFLVHKYRVKDGVRFCSHSCRSTYNIIHNIFVSPTTIEAILYDTLAELGVEFIRQRPINAAHTIVDTFIPAYNAVIYADGDYWHTLPKVIERDKAKNAALETLGYHVYRFWEHDLRTNARSCVQKVVDECAM